MGFPCGSDGKESACNVGDLGSIPGLGRPPGRGHGNIIKVIPDYSSSKNKGKPWVSMINYILSGVLSYILHEISHQVMTKSSS